MSHSNRFIVLTSLLFSANLYAVEFFFEPFYWRTTELFDWVLVNDLSTPNQQVTYQTTSFDYDPGFKVGIGYACPWDIQFSYTWFHTATSDNATGNVRSQMIGGFLARPSGNFFYQSGQINFKIDYNMFDLDFGDTFQINRDLSLSPLIGIKGGWIHQTLNTSFQGAFSIDETVKQKFTGVGPKIGIGTKVGFFSFEDLKLNALADFAAAFMWGHWSFSDVATLSTGRTIIAGLDSRNFGSLTAQAIFGVSADYQCFSMKLSYEIDDWFDQFQIVDDVTGGHNNDLIFQGVTLKLAYDF